jgi:hypothetical protein
MTRNEEKLLYWLLRAYIGYKRQGWEEGPTCGEVLSRINEVLANHGICGDDEGPPNMFAAGQKLLRRYDRKEWKEKSAQPKAKIPDTT